MPQPEKKVLTKLQEQAITLIDSILAHGGGKLEIIIENAKSIKVRDTYFRKGATD